MTSRNYCLKGSEMYIATPERTPGLKTGPGCATKRGKVRFA